MSQLDLLEARQSRDDGVARATEHAGETWMDRAVSDFAAFVFLHGEATCEQWRSDWIARGNDEPVTHKAYGAVALTAAKRGLIINTRRYVQATSAKTHAHPVPIWKAMEV